MKQYTNELTPSVLASFSNPLSAEHRAIMVDYVVYPDGTPVRITNSSRSVNTNGSGISFALVNCTPPKQCLQLVRFLHIQVKILAVFLESMMMINLTRSILRWGGIITVSLCYLITLVASTFSFSAFTERESMRFTGPISLKEYHTAIDLLMQATDGVFNVALFGFAICVPLILLIFKKVR